MLRRFTLAILALCLALPAIAQPIRCPPLIASLTAPGHNHNHHAPAPIPASAPLSASPHDCIGCIPPGTGAPPIVVGSPLTALPSPYRIGLPDALPVRDIATPPPRS